MTRQTPAKPPQHLAVSVQQNMQWPWTAADKAIGKFRLRHGWILTDRVSDVIDGVLGELCRNYISVGGLLLHSSIGRVLRLYGRTQDRAPPGFRQGGVPARFPQEDIMPYGNYFVAEALHRRLRGDSHFPLHLVASRFTAQEPT
jgi:hypothetical protein